MSYNSYDRKPKDVVKVRRFHLRVSINEVEVTIGDNDTERRVREVTALSQSGEVLSEIIEFAKDHLHLLQTWTDRAAHESTV